MFKKTKLFLLGALLVSPLTAAPADTIQQADGIFAARTDFSGAEQALSLYKKVMEENPDNIEAQWKAARAIYWIADHSTSTKDKLRLFEEGIKMAEKTVQLDPKSVDAHFWLGGLYGSYGETKGVLKSLALVKPIRREMDAINRLDDTYQGGAGYRVMGIVDYKVPGFAGGSRKRAIENLNKALEIDPNNAFTRFYLAEYFQLTKNKAKALEHLDALEKIEPTKDVDAPDLKMMKARGAELRKRVEK